MHRFKNYNSRFEENDDRSKNHSNDDNVGDYGGRNDYARRSIRPHNGTVQNGNLRSSNGYYSTRDRSEAFGRRQRLTAHDWTFERESNVVDDGTMTFFWRAHTLLVLFVLTCYLIYVALFETPSDDSEYNMKRGIVALVSVFLLFGVTQIPDGPFKRPHPALWRFVFCLSIVYELGLIYVLFQTVDDARKVLTHFDSTLGEPLPEKDYGGNCLIYDPDSPSDPFHNLWDKIDGFVVTHFVGFWLKTVDDARKVLTHFDSSLGEPLPEKDYGGNCLIYDPDSPSDPFHNVWDKIDGFVVTHFLGFWLKTLMLRDSWLCTVQSIVFEILEYSLEHQLPNLSECWWDHWIMDASICNGLGIYCGMRTLRYLNLKEYNWRGMWTFDSFRGKVKRVALQFTPYTWMKYDWRPFESFKRCFLLAELNTFYLKFVLWLPPPHYLNLVRLFFFMLAGAVAMRETFQYMDDPKCKTFGRQSWVILSIIITEFLVIAKFGWETITKPLPFYVVVFWSFALVLLAGWTVWNFFLKPLFWHNIEPDPATQIDYPFAADGISNGIPSKNPRKPTASYSDNSTTYPSVGNS